MSHESFGPRGVIYALLALFGICGKPVHAIADEPVAGNGRTALIELGRKIFFDLSLSASGKLACASCHDPRYAYGPPPGKAIAVGGPGMNQSGARAVPSLRYLHTVPAFSEHMHFTDGDTGPGGGYMWDGRAASLKDQASLPLLAANEMANPSPASIVHKVRRALYSREFRAVFGDTIFNSTERAFQAVLDAIDAFEHVPEEFYPFSSKYDAFLRGEVDLDDAEERGVAVFKDLNKGNCASCHITVTRNGSPPLFTDYDYANVGAPRNRALAANADPAHYDLGLCGPARADLSNKKAYCGLFRAPTLRNVALRDAFFHNAVFHTLREAIEFYDERDTHPERWYPRLPDGTVDKINDMPADLRASLNTEPPFDRQPGDKPAMSRQDIDDLIAFLNTLTDGYRVPSPAETHVPFAAAHPDEYAWQLFLRLNQPGDAAASAALAPDGGHDEATLWETWKNANDVYLAGGVDPGPWTRTTVDQSDLRTTRFALFTPEQRLNARRIVNGTVQAIEDLVPQAEHLKEMRMNEITYDYIRANHLYSIEGQLGRLLRHEPVSFPAGAQEVKAEWTLIEPATQSKYHTLTVRGSDGSVRLYGLTALHIMSKDLPTWFWATFEHVDNPSLPASEGWQLPSKDIYACGSNESSCNRAPAAATTVWRYYRLRGTQTQFIDQDGVPTRLANSRFETGMQTTASCMTCHSRASIGGSTLAPLRLATTMQDDGEAVHGGVRARRGFLGAPDRTWFYDSQPHADRQLLLPLDFVWSLAKAQTEASSLASAAGK